MKIIDKCTFSGGLAAKFWYCLIIENIDNPAPA
jgi:hypothetical protein